MLNSQHIDAARLAGVMLPEFFEYSGCVFARYVASERFYKAYQRNKPLPETEKWAQDRTAVEAFENHFHVLDLFSNGNAVRQRHRAFTHAEILGKAIAHSWYSQLLSRYPNTRFRIYYTRGDHPTVRFHRDYKSEVSWLDESSCAGDIEAGNVLVFETSGFPA